MDVSIVVPFRDSRRSFERCLASLAAQRADGAQVELVLVDNGSSDGSAGMAQEFASARLVRETRPGPYAARNTGVAASRGSIIAFTDADCVPADDWLDALLSPFRDGRVDVVIGARTPHGRSRALSLLSAYDEARDRFVFGSDVADIYYAFANNMAVRREAFEQHGPFVERMRGSDSLFVRAVVAGTSPGAVRYAPAARVEHLEIARVRDYYRKLFVYGRSLRSFGPLGPVRRLTPAERIGVWRQAIADRRRGDALALLALLAVGSLFWSAGSCSARLRA